jgi:hypothetical protein
MSVESSRRRRLDLKRQRPPSVLLPIRGRFEDTRECSAHNCNSVANIAPERILVGVFPPIFHEDPETGQRRLCPIEPFSRFGDRHLVSRVSNRLERLLSGTSNGLFDAGDASVKRDPASLGRVNAGGLSFR